MFFSLIQIWPDYTHGRTPFEGEPPGRVRNNPATYSGARPKVKACRTDSLASNDFTYYFTFSSKFFSSFPHGTCSLSVFRKYLALEGHYLPISAAVPSNTTHGLSLFQGAFRTGRGCYPLRRAISTTTCTRSPQRGPTQVTMHTPRARAFHIELIPLHSPLLGESWLVSFPPLSNMLKFSGSSYLRSALVRSETKAGGIHMPPATGVIIESTTLTVLLYIITQLFVQLGHAGARIEEIPAREARRDFH